MIVWHNIVQEFVYLFICVSLIAYTLHVQAIWKYFREKYVFKSDFLLPGFSLQLCVVFSVVYLCLLLVCLMQSTTGKGARGERKVVAIDRTTDRERVRESEGRGRGEWFWVTRRAGGGGGRSYECWPLSFYINLHINCIKWASPCFLISSPHFFPSCICNKAPPVLPAASDWTAVPFIMSVHITGTSRGPQS